MMWKEFEELAGYEVTYEDYSKIIEPMYMATDLNKRDFIACLDYKRFSIQYRKEQMKHKMVKRLKELAAQMKAEAGHVDTYETFSELHGLAREYDKEFPHYGATGDYEREYKNNSQYIKGIVWYDDRTGAVVGRLTLVA